MTRKQHNDTYTRGRGLDTLPGDCDHCGTEAPRWRFGAFGRTYGHDRMANEYICGDCRINYRGLDEQIDLPVAKLSRNQRARLRRLFGTEEVSR